MYTSLRIRVFCFLTLSAVVCAVVAHGQCVGIPAVTSLGSNKFPVGLCAPVQANVTYAVAFAAPVAAGHLELVYDWGDGSAPEIVSLTPGSKTYNAALTHTYPGESDCEYLVTMGVRYNGKTCLNTTQIQKISSWRTDEFNGGDVSLISPATKTGEHLVCEGENISIVFEDHTNWNCNGRFENLTGSLVESPNTEYRWQQIIYNTGNSKNKIPNVSVDGLAVTGADGSDLVSRYEDPRGVFYMTAPVLVEDARRRPSLRITAPGGFGVGLPKAGDIFEVTLRYWNFCNPYDDPEIPGPPTDKINGDHPAVEAKAVIKVVAPPPALEAKDIAVCYGTTPDSFSVKGMASGNLINWYRYVPGSDAPGELLSTGKSASFSIASHPDWKNNKTPGVYRVWATQRSNTSEATNCESPATLVTRIIREQLDVPAPVVSVPAQSCNGESFVVTLPPPDVALAGGATHYSWTTSPGIVLTSETNNTAGFSVNISDFGPALFVDRILVVSRRYAAEPACAASATYTIRVFRNPEGGILRGAMQACEVNPVGALTLTDFVGEVSGWEVRKDDGVYAPYDGEATATSISPGVLAPGTYMFRARVKNGPCKEVYSNEQIVEVSANPGAAFAGEDQFICNALSSAGLSARLPRAGSGLWTYVSSIPAGLPPPSFDPNDPNTSVVITAANAGVYTLRWTVTNGSCTDFDDVTIDFGTTPTDAHAGSDKSVCGPLTHLEGNVPEKGTGSWSVVSGPNGCSGNDCPVTILSAASPASAVELTGTAPMYGVYTFRWSISSGGNKCFLKSDEVTVTFEHPVEIIANDVHGICLGKNNPESIELAGTIRGPVASSAWSILSGDGSVTGLSTSSADGVHTVKAAYHPGPADYVKGTPVKIKLAAMPSSASCGMVEDIITINFERKPVADAGADIGDICSDYAILDAATPEYGAQGMWRSAQPGVSFDDPADPQTIIRGLPVGETLVTWTVVSGGGSCPAQVSSVKLVRVSLPDVSDLSVTACETQPGHTAIVLGGYEDAITSLAPDVRVIEWFGIDPQSVLTPIRNAHVMQSEIADSTVYLARVRDLRTGCSSDANVTVTARPLPSVSNAAVTLCEDVAGSGIVSEIDLSGPAFSEAITSIPDAQIEWFSSAADAATGHFPITEPVLVNGGKEFYAAVTYASAPHCTSIARLNIVVNPQPAVTKIIGRESVCQGISSPVSNDLSVQVYQVTPIAGARYHWEIPDAPGEFVVFGGGGERDFYVLLQFPNVYTGKIRVRAEINGCQGPLVEKEIAVSAAPARPLILGPSVVCENSSHIAFHVSPNNFPLSAYNWEVRNAADDAVDDAYIAEGQLTGNVLVTIGKGDVIISVRENNAECVSPAATHFVKVADPPKAILTVQKEISCFMGGDGALQTEVSGGTAPFTGFEIVQTGRTDADNDGIFTHLGPGRYTVRLKDANGCYATTNVQELQQPKAPAAEFLVAKAGDACDNTEHLFTWEAEAGIDYRWEWGDGTVTTLPGHVIEPGINTVAHAFTPLSSVNVTEYPVRLFANAPGCLESAGTASVFVSPVIRLNILAGDTLLCSSDDITFFNNSLGVARGQWYCRVPGTSETIAPSAVTDRKASFTLHNTTSDNPLVYEVVYEAESSAGCKSVYRQRVVVYRANTAGFEIGAVPPFETGSVQVEIENTSTVRDDAQFTYHWSYGDYGTAKFPSTTGPFELTYYSPGKKEISLTVVNRDAEEAGKACQSVYRKEITIPQHALHAAITVTPFASCFPVSLQVTNTSTGADRFVWRVFRDGALVATSNLRVPEFRITSPGVYEVALTASVASTGKEEEMRVGGIRVMDVPDAAFEVRSALIYVPDTELQVSNFSRNANRYEWHFGDGAVAEGFAPVHTYQQEGRYTITLVSALDHGQVDVDGDGVADHALVCYDSARQDVVARSGGSLVIPNAFTPDTRGPNGGYPSAGGFNDVFLPVVQGATDFHMQVYDRWGTLVFETFDQTKGWDGYDRNQRLMPAGVYIYKIVFRQSDGETITRAGDVSLIR